MGEGQHIYHAYEVLRATLMDGVNYEAACGGFGDRTVLDVDGTERCLVCWAVVARGHTDTQHG